jgi:hypothetical protein
VIHLSCFVIQPFSLSSSNSTPIRETHLFSLMMPLYVRSKTRSAAARLLGSWVRIPLRFYSVSSQDRLTVRELSRAEESKTFLSGGWNLHLLRYSNAGPSKNVVARLSLSSKNPARQDFYSKFCKVALDTCGVSTLSLLHISLLAPRILRLVFDFFF